MSRRYIFWRTVVRSLFALTVAVALMLICSLVIA